MAEIQADRVLRRAEVERVIGLTERMLRALEAEGKFPKRFTIAPNGRALGWSAREVQEWLAERIKRREPVAHRHGMARKGQRIGSAA